jgi:hypothetical protein
MNLTILLVSVSWTLHFQALLWKELGTMQYVSTYKKTQTLSSIFSIDINTHQTIEQCPTTLTHFLSLWPLSASELYRLSNRSLSAKSVPTFVDRGCHVVSATDSYSRILDFLGQSRYYFFQVAPQLHSGWVDPVPDPLLLRKSGRARNRTQDLWNCSQELLATRPQKWSHTWGEAQVPWHGQYKDWQNYCSNYWGNTFIRFINIILYDQYTL